MEPPCLGPISKCCSTLFHHHHHHYYYLLLCLCLCLGLGDVVQCGDYEALQTLKSSIDPSNSALLQWQGSSNVCNWQGVKECINGRVTKLVLEHLNLSGTLISSSSSSSSSLNQLDQLRVLSFKANSISGEIPDLSALINLKSLYLNDNNFSGNFPASVSLLHRLKVIVLSGNQITGSIPNSLLNLRRLYVLYLQENRLTGEIPPLNQSSLRFFNVSNNQLSGEIPVTSALVRFNDSSFSGNIALCGQQIHNNNNSHLYCNGSQGGLTPSMSPTEVPLPSTKKHPTRWKIIAIIAGSSIVGFLLCLFVLCLVFRKTSSRRKNSREVVVVGGTKGAVGGGEEVEGQVGEGSGLGGGGGKQGGGGGFSWEGEGLGSLVFCGGGDHGEQKMSYSYSLEDLLKASAETLGRGTMGSTYKAVMESGFIVTVKRLKDARYPRTEEFRRHMDLVLGRLNHPNLVPLRAYFQAKDERLLVYDYFPNGSLFSLIHGSRGSGGGKPLHWTSCLKIAEDLATGLVYIHLQDPGLTHGNLKSSNVLLGSDFESCLTDYGLTPFRNPDSQEEYSSACALFYRAPECRDLRKLPTQQADVYSFGVLLLELLTGKTPFQDLVQEHASDIPRWVRSVREEETTTESGGDEPAAGAAAEASASASASASEEKLGALLNIAMACVSLAPDNRPAMREVLRMIREARAEAHVSSNSSTDHSPGRWSDTVQSLPREEHLSI